MVSIMTSSYQLLIILQYNDVGKVQMMEDFGE